MASLLPSTANGMGIETVIYPHAVAELYCLKQIPERQHNLPTMLTTKIQLNPI